MHAVLLIALRELRVTLRRASFVFATLLMPLVLGAILWSTVLLEEQDAPPAASAALAPAGWVDHAEVIRTVPPAMEALLIRYEREADAVAAMRAGTIESYMLIAADYRRSGEVLYTSRQLSIMAADAPQVEAFETLLRANLVSSPLLVRRIAQPPDLAVTLLDQPQQRDPAANSAALALALGWLLAFALLNGAGWLVQAVAEEKENRTIEIMLTTVQPWQIMAGKVAGLGAVSLLQFSLWLLLGSTLLTTLSVVDQGALSALGPITGLWLIVFFVLGFLLFGAMMAALGAVGATARESGQISGFLLLPLLAPMWFSTALVEHPDGTLAVVLSLIPITAPVTIMLRLALGAVPVWQMLLSVGVLALAVVGMLWLAARLFRSATLLAGVKPTPRVLWRALHQP